jgi:hypothetical protein
VIDNPDAFKADLERLLKTYREKGDRWVKHAAFIQLLKVFERFVEAWDKETYELLAPVMQEYERGLVDLINGRNPEIFRAAPRRGKRWPKADDIQPQARVGLYVDRKMVAGVDKETAINEAARKFHCKAGSVAYWLRQATDGSAPWAALFDLDRRVLTVKYPDSPERQAAALLKAHRQGQKKFSP